MRVLLLTHGFNCLSQRLFVELEARGHEISVEFDINDGVTEEATRLFKPDVLIAPFLKRAIPESVWRALPCFIVHPGVPGDRGPSALDWAILENALRWGVTVLQAEAEMDAGPVWASREFPMRAATKSSLYRHEATEAAVACVVETLERFEQGGFTPERVARRPMRPAMTQTDRAIDWERDATDVVLRKIRSGDGSPGVRDRIFGRTVYLYDARPASPPGGGRAGEILAVSGPAICRRTTDGAVWIGHLRDPKAENFKLPAVRVLNGALAGLPEIPMDSEIRYEEQDGAGFLSFAPCNGAFSTAFCERLLAAYRAALARPTRVLALMGGPDFWSNGIHLNLIEASANPADESWRNINAMNDLAEAILRTDDRLTVSALAANAGAGGVYLARAADLMWLRDGVTLSPHYKDMGNLYGSEFWTYSLPRRAGAETAAAIMARRLPMGAAEAVRIRLADARFGETASAFAAEARRRAIMLASAPDHPARLAAKRAALQADETAKPLACYRAEELERMHLNFYGFDPSYHVARSNFVRKTPKSRTPVTLARHRDIARHRDLRLRAWRAS
jgi:putative two-component system protein, hydrogenase maturation factor HypX/HoxX